MTLLRTLSRHPLFQPVLAIVALLVAAHFHPSTALALPLALGVLTETAHPGGFLVMESPGTISRDAVTLTVPASTTFRPGTVLGRITGSGKYVQYDDSRSDGGGTVAGILYGVAANDSLAPVDQVAAIVDYSAEVRAADLIWIEDADIVAGTAGLRLLGIKTRPAQ